MKQSSIRSYIRTIVLLGFIAVDGGVASAVAASMAVPPEPTASTQTTPKPKPKPKPQPQAKPKPKPKAVVAKRVIAKPAPAPIPKTGRIKFVHGIASMRGLSTKLKKIRVKMIGHKTVTDAELKTLADADDGLAAYLYGVRIEKLGNPAQLETVVQYYAAAAYDGRGVAVRPLVTLLTKSSDTLSPEVLLKARRALEEEAAHRDPAAVDALVRFHGDQPIFGADPKLVEGYLTAAANGGNAQAALDLALARMGPDASKADHATALKYLALAGKSGDLGMRTMAENLTRSLTTAPPEAEPKKDVSP